jgi:hypothetical protein
VALVEALRFGGRVDDLRRRAHRFAFRFRQAVLVVVVAIDARRVDRHRAVEEDRHVGDAPVALEQVDQVHQGLRAADGEGGNHHHAAALEGAVQDLRHFLGDIARRVAALAVGRFDHQAVGRRQRIGCHHYQIMGAPQIAREHHRPSLVVQAYRRCAEQVAGARQAQRQSAAEIDVFTEADRHQLFQRGVGLFLCVQRQRRPVSGKPVAVGEVSLLFLQTPAVGQQYLAQVARRGGAQHLAGKAVTHQQRQGAAVVEVGVGQDDSVDVRRRDRQRRPVAQTQLLEALEQAAIDQHLPAACTHQIFRAGYRARGTEKLDFHALPFLQGCAAIVRSSSFVAASLAAPHASRAIGVCVCGYHHVFRCSRDAVPGLQRLRDKRQDIPCLQKRPQLPLPAFR